MRLLTILSILTIGFNNLHALTPRKKTVAKSDSVVTTVTETLFQQTNDFLDPDSILISGKDLVENVPQMMFFDKCKLGGPVMPCPINVISHFGTRHSRMHTGTDIKLNKGDNVYAMFNGVVSRSSSYYGYGNLVVINHGDGLETYYGHLSQRYVSVGDTITAGRVIGAGGRTGRATTEHLHFEFRINGKPYDAEKIFAFSGVQDKTNIFGMKEEMIQVIKDKPSAVKSTGNSDLEDETDAADKSTGSTTHTIKKGETLYSISKKYKTSVNKLCAINKLTSRTVLKVGSRIKIN